MFVSLQRTSQSPVIYEVLDFAVGITDPAGELVSQGNGIAGFLGPLGEAARATIERVADLEARSTLDIEKKRTIYRRLHEILAEEVPYTYLWTLTNYAAYNRKLRRVEIHPTRFFTYIRDWYIPPGDQRQ